MRSILFLAACGFALLALAVFLAGSGDDAHAQQATAINAGNFYFCADEDQGKVCETTVNAGATVTWSIEEGTHQIVQCDASFATCPPAGGFDSGSLSTGKTFSHTFPAAGTFEYHCAFHPTQMMGRITVAAAQASAAPTAAPTAAPSGAAATASPKVPGNLGGPPSDGGTAFPWAILLAALGGLFIIGSVAAATRAVRSR